MKPEERQTLERLFSLAPKLELAYEFCQQLTDIFEQDLSKKVAKINIQAWIKKVRASGFKCFDDFLKTLTHWWEEITNYFVSRANSGFVEGFNNKLKVLKRRCYEIYNLEHLFQRIYLDLEVEKKTGLGHRLSIAVARLGRALRDDDSHRRLYQTPRSLSGSPS